MPEDRNTATTSAEPDLESPGLTDGDGFEKVLEPGCVVEDKYQVLSVIGRGGTSTVYKARGIMLERLVALKVLHADYLNNKATVESFRKEYLTVATLNHNAIVTVYGIGTLPDTGQPFIVMDLFEGCSLTNFLETNGKLNLDQFLCVFGAVLSGLKHAHEKGIVHRDIKPGNIMINGQGGTLELVKIVDFGLAKSLVNHAGGDTTTGIIKGTMSYMSPEQCKAGAVDQRSDIYSLGCVMYESLTGSKLFAGESQFEIMYKHLHHSASNLSEVKTLPGAIGRMVTKCLKRDPDERYQSVTELESDLRNCAEEGDITVPPRSATLLAKTPMLCVILVLTFAISWKVRPPSMSSGASQNITRITDSTDSTPLPHDASKFLNLIRKMPLDKALKCGARWLESRTQAPDADQARVCLNLATLNLNKSITADNAKPFHDQARELSQRAFKLSAPGTLEHALAEKILCVFTPQRSRIQASMACIRNLQALPRSTLRNEAITDILLTVGQQAMLQRDYVEAEKYFARAMKLGFQNDQYGRSRYFLPHADALLKIPSRRAEAVPEVERLLKEELATDHRTTRAANEMHQVARWYRVNGDCQQAESWCRKALNAMPADEAASIMEDLISILEAEGKINEAWPMVSTVLKSEKVDKNNRGSLSTHYSLRCMAARIALARADKQVAIRLARKCIEDLKLQPPPKLDYYQNFLTSALNTLVSAAATPGEIASAQAWLMQQIPTCDDICKGYIYYYAGTMNSTAGQYQAAIKYYATASDIFQQEGSLHWLLCALTRQAELEIGIGDNEGARKLLDRALAASSKPKEPLPALSSCLQATLRLPMSEAQAKITEDKLLALAPPNSPEALDCMITLAQREKDKNNISALKVRLKKAVELLGQLPPEVSVQRAKAFQSCGILLAPYDRDRSNTLLKESISVLNRVGPNTLSKSEFAVSYFHLAENSTTLASAMEAYRPVFSIREADDPARQLAAFTYKGMLCLKFGDGAGAEQAFRRAYRLIEQLQPETRSYLLPYLADALTLQGKTTEARAACYQGLALVNAMSAGTRRDRWHALLLRSLGESLIRSGRLQEARQVLHQCINHLSQRLYWDSKEQLERALGDLLHCYPADSAEAAQLRVRIEKHKSE